MNDASAQCCIPLVFCFDRNYLPFASVATVSACQNTKHPLRIYWIFPENLVDEASESRRRISHVATDIRFIPNDMSQLADWNIRGHINTAAYFRILIPDLVPEKKVIYLDCDILVLQDLNELFKIPTGPSGISGVAHPEGTSLTRIPLSKNDSYINSGVLLLDIEYLRKDSFVTRTKEIYFKYHQYATWVDQCIINKSCELRKGILDPKWNFLVLPQSENTNQLSLLIRKQEIAIVHFAGSIKPWHAWCHPSIREFWWAYAQNSGLDRSHLQPIETFKQARSLLLALQKTGPLREILTTHLRTFVRFPRSYLTQLPRFAKQLLTG
ncbi:MAG: glycosyltransferase family 8 protein [Pseudomonadota bacterium]|nr:glycosyltransferase family 8 protein [Pseudomonadota bacterium]